METRTLIPYNLSQDLGWKSYMKCLLALLVMSCIFTSLDEIIGEVMKVVSESGLTYVAFFTGTLHRVSHVMLVKLVYVHEKTIYNVIKLLQLVSNLTFWLKYEELPVHL